MIELREVVRKGMAHGSDVAAWSQCSLCVPGSVCQFNLLFYLFFVVVVCVYVRIYVCMYVCVYARVCE